MTDEGGFVSVTRVRGHLVKSRSEIKRAVPDGSRQRVEAAIDAREGKHLFW